MAGSVTTSTVDNAADEAMKDHLMALLSGMSEQEIQELAQLAEDCGREMGN